MPRPDSLHLLTALLRSPAAVGAIAPSSPSLARAMLRGLRLAPGRAILELGPGTGPFTRQIHQQLPDPAAYLGIETDPRLVELLRSRYPALRLVHGSAEHMTDHLREAGLDSITAIISGLPFASLPAPVQARIVDQLDALMIPGVTFRTFQYLHAWPLPSAARFRRQMAERFGPPRIIRPVARNLPPALVLSWRRRAHAAQPVAA